MHRAVDHYLNLCGQRGLRPVADWGGNPGNSLVPGQSWQSARDDPVRKPYAFALYGDSRFSENDLSRIQSAFPSAACDYGHEGGLEAGGFGGIQVYAPYCIIPAVTIPVDQAGVWIREKTNWADAVVLLDNWEGPYPGVSMTTTNAVGMRWSCGTDACGSYYPVCAREHE